MSINYVPNDESGGSAANVAAGQAVFTFKGAAETIEQGDFVTLDQNTGTIQRANTISASLFGSVTAGADAAVSLSAWGTTAAAKVYENTDGTLLYAEGYYHAGLINGNPKLIKVSANGASILATVSLSTNTGGVPVLTPLSGSRMAYMYYKGTAQLGVDIYDVNTLALLESKTIAFTGGATYPFSNSGDAIETGNGQIVLCWSYGSYRYYATLNADLTVKTNPTQFGTFNSSFQVAHRLKLQSGRVLFACVWSDSSAGNSGIIHFDASGVFVSSKDFGQVSLSSPNWEAQIKARERRYVCPVTANRVGYILYANTGSTFYILDLSTDAVVLAEPVGGVNHEITWCLKGDYAYVLAMYNSGTPVELRRAVFNVATATVKTAFSALLSNITIGYSQGFSAAFFRGADEFWLLGTDATNAVRGNIWWWVFTLVDGVVSIKYARASIASLGAIQDIVITANEALIVYGGTTDGTSVAPLMAFRLDLRSGVSAGAVQIRPHATSGQASMGGLAQSPETKMLFWHSIETAMLFGYGVGSALNVLTRAYFKPNASLLLGVAAKASVAGEVQAILSGWANVNARYSAFQKTIDHAAQNGNKAKTYGAAAYLTGSF